MYENQPKYFENDKSNIWLDIKLKRHNEDWRVAWGFSHLAMFWGDIKLGGSVNHLGRIIK